MPTHMSQNTNQPLDVPPAVSWNKYTYMFKTLKYIHASSCASKEHCESSMCGFFCFWLYLTYISPRPQRLSKGYYVPLWLKSEDDSIMSVCALVSTQKFTKPHNHDVSSAQKPKKIKLWLALALVWLIRLYKPSALYILCHNSDH